MPLLWRLPVAYVGRMWFWLAVLACLLLGLGALWMSDRRARRLGHTFRSARAVYRSVRESKRDARVFDGLQGWLNTTSTMKWTAWSRRNSENAQENRRDDA